MYYLNNVQMHIHLYERAKPVNILINKKQITLNTVGFFFFYPFVQSKCIIFITKKNFKFALFT